jgi:hypothetical protein
MISARYQILSSLVIATVFGSFLFPYSALEQSPPINQPLSQEQKRVFYHASEGAEFFPLTWMQALNNCNTHEPFLSHLERYGLIRDPNASAALPIGFTVDKPRDLKMVPFGPMVGVNCAACHVTELTANSHTELIDGAPSQFNVEQFFGELFRSVTATVESGDEFYGFLKRLYQHGSTDRSPFALHLSELANLHSASAREEAFQQEINRMVEEQSKVPPTDLKSGLQVTKEEPLLTVPLTNDDFQSLFATKPASVLSRDHTMPLSEATLRIMAAPVKPDSAFANLSANDVEGLLTDAKDTLILLKSRVKFFMALVHEPTATMPGYGRVDAFGDARNVLFPKFAKPSTAPVSYFHLWGLVHLNKVHWDDNTNSVMEANVGQAIGSGAIADPDTGISTVNIRNLHQLELLAKSVPVPSWPGAFGQVNSAQVEAGRLVFKSECAHCHSTTIIDPQQGEQLSTDIGTDPNRAALFQDKVGNQSLADAIHGLIAKVKQKAYETAGLSPQEIASCDLPENKIHWQANPVYTQRSLAGTWATAPYLHNNSVPTMYDLLSTKRPSKFLLQFPNYDPKNMGIMYKNDAQLTATDRSSQAYFDTSLPGNDNHGHGFGTDLTEDQKRALIEYLKTI